MQSLTAIAVAKARKMIEDKFQDPNVLEELGTMGFNLEKNLLEVDSQLNGAVSNKLDSLKRAVDLMDESVAKLAKLSSNIQKIDEKIAITNTAISNYEYLKRASCARDNLRRVLEQVDFFASVPERVAGLRKRLNEQPGQLKEVFLEALKLEALRAALIKEIKISRSRRMSVEGAGAAFGGDYSEESFFRVKESVERHLNPVPELMKEVNRVVLSNIDRMFDLAPNAPEDLVTTFEIIEMQQEYNERRNKATRAALASAAGNGANPSSSVNGSRSNQKAEFYEDISANVQNRIRKLLDHQMEGEFEAIAGYVQQSKSVATAFITAANQALFKIKFFQSEVQPCMPPHYDPLFMCLEAFEFFFTPKLEQIVADMQTLKVAEILDIITWIELHKASLEDFDFGSRDSIERYSQLKVELLVEYKERIKTQVHAWFANIASQSVEITRSTSGVLVTNKPEDMFNIIHAQLSVAHDKLPPDYVKEVGIACLQVLQDVQRQTYDTLTRGKALEVEELCALINDNQRMQEKCDEFGKDLLRMVAEESERDVLEAVLDEVSREYLSIAKRAVQTLAAALVDVLDEPVFLQLYSPGWENDDNPVNTLVVTLQDYFGDLCAWLSDYHFSKLLRELLSALLWQYTMSLRRKITLATGLGGAGTAGGGGEGEGEGDGAAGGGPPPSTAAMAAADTLAFTFTNELLAAKKIILDRIALADLFEKYLPLLRTTGIRSKEGLADELDALQHLTKIVTCRHLSAVENDCKALFARFGVDGLRLVQAGLLTNPTVPRAERQSNSEGAKKLFDSLSAGMKYDLVPRPEYAAFDSAFLAAAHEQRHRARGFWAKLRGNKDMIR